MSVDHHKTKQPTVPDQMSTTSLVLL